MTNGEKYKSIDDRVYAFRRYCAETTCPNCCIKPYVGARRVGYVDRCILKWLALEAEEKPLPCPFCGAEAEIDSAIHHGSYYYFVECKNCHMSSISCLMKNEAIAAWNRRVK